jgi:hypothetical protein
VEKLIAALNEAGLAITPEMGEEQITKVAKAMGIEPLDYLERKVEITQHTNKRNQTNTFVATPPFVVSRENGQTRSVRGLFLRVEALDQAIEDLLAARELINK